MALFCRCPNGESSGKHHRREACPPGCHNVPSWSTAHNPHTLVGPTIWLNGALVRAVAELSPCDWFPNPKPPMRIQWYYRCGPVEGWSDSKEEAVESVRAQQRQRSG